SSGGPQPTASASSVTTLANRQLRAVRCHGTAILCPPCMCCCTHPCRSKLTGHLASTARAQGNERHDIDLFAEKADRAVGHRHLHAARVKRQRIRPFIRRIDESRTTGGHPVVLKAVHPARAWPGPVIEPAAKLRRIAKRLIGNAVTDDPVRSARRFMHNNGVGSSVGDVAEG